LCSAAKLVPSFSKLSVSWRDARLLPVAEEKFPIELASESDGNSGSDALGSSLWWSAGEGLVFPRPESSLNSESVMLTRSEGESSDELGNPSELEEFLGFSGPWFSPESELARPELGSDLESELLLVLREASLTLADAKSFSLSRKSRESLESLPDPRCDSKSEESSLRGGLPRGEEESDFELEPLDWVPVVPCRCSAGWTCRRCPSGWSARKASSDSAAGEGS